MLLAPEGEFSALTLAPEGDMQVKLAPEGDVSALKLAPEGDVQVK